MIGQLDAFLEMMAAERGAARHTLDAYRRDLAAFAAFLRDDDARWARAAQEGLVTRAQ